MEETINLSDLETTLGPAPIRVDPDRNRLDLSGVINNTSIEDQVTSLPDAFSNRDIVENIQTISDLRNRSNLLEQRFNSAAEDVSNATSGRAFAGPGQRNSLAQRRNSIDSERRAVVARLEEERGNLDTARSLRAESERLAASAAQAARDEIDGSSFDSLTTNTEEPLPEGEPQPDLSQEEQNVLIIQEAERLYGPLAKLDLERALAQGQDTFNQRVPAVSSIYGSVIRAPRSTDTSETELNLQRSNAADEAELSANGGTRAVSTPAFSSSFAPLI